ncbi:hypothetical protein [uncultured Alcanivorax sp.]|uniref:hypothetical protein n=1 Tax=uncultured Alcanivorax sp. TaxID=191215 RepID=UPI0025F9F598|nr:hypothetical protein [uncultured Alcanivorax sp.]
MSFTGLRVRANDGCGKTTLDAAPFRHIPFYSARIFGGAGLAETELERAEKRYAQAKARLQALRNREATRQRKLDTRRKVILGGALMDLAERDSGAAAMVERLVRNLSRDQDRKAFAEWGGPSSGDETPSPTSDPDGAD